MHFLDFEETTVEIGHDGRGFAYDNEGPRHRALIPAFSLASRPVTNGEYIAFIEDNGYARPEFWLSLGWTTVNEQRWHAPLYWTKRDGAWWNFTLSGFRPVNESVFIPCHAELPLTIDPPPDGFAVANLFTKCLAMFGNGRAAPTLPTPVIARRPAHLGNTTASSCATNTFYGAVPAPRHAVTFAAPIAISFNRKNAGSLQGSDSHAIHAESVRCDRRVRAER